MVRSRFWNNSLWGVCPIRRKWAAVKNLCFTVLDAHSPCLPSSDSYLASWASRVLAAFLPSMIHHTWQAMHRGTLDTKSSIFFLDNIPDPLTISEKLAAHRWRLNLQPEGCCLIEKLFSLFPVWHQHR